MIDMNDLRPWLEGKGEAITNEDLEAIQAMDKPAPEDQTATIEELNQKLADSEERYRSAFFNPPKQPPNDPGALPDDPEPEDDTPESFDDLFKPKKEGE